MFKTNPLINAEDNIWLYQMHIEQNKRIAKNISTQEKRKKQLGIIDKDLF